MIFCLRLWERRTVSEINKIWADKKKSEHVSFIFIFLPADDEFQKLCFAFGVELDEVVSILSLRFDCNSNDFFVDN